jgi:hypothetical protein
MKLGKAAFRSLFMLWAALLLAAPWALVLTPARAAHAAAPDCLAAGAALASPVRARGLASGTRAALAPYAPLACPTGLIAFWKLDDAAGPPYVDSANDHDGTCTSINCPVPATGLVGSAQVFSSTTEVNVPAHVDFNWGVNDSFSIEYWMQTASASTCAGNQVVLGRDVTSGPDTNLHWWTGCEATTGKAAFYARDLDNNLFSVIGTTDLTDGNWHHVVAVRDADTDELRLYVDGVLQGSTPAVYTNGFATASKAVNLGWLQAGAIYHFVGNLDELAVYSRALALPEIEQHRTANLGGAGICDTVVPPPDFELFLPLIMG